MHFKTSILYTKRGGGNIFYTEAVVSKCYARNINMHKI